MLKTAIGISDSVDIDAAMAEVIRACVQQLGGEKPQAGIFFTSRMDSDLTVLLDAIHTAFPEIKLIGCTTDGEIGPGCGYLQDAVSLLVLASDTIRFATAVATDLSRSAEASFKKAFSECLEQMDCPPVMGITLPDGLSTAGVALDRAIQSAMGKQFPLFGGTAGDGFQLKGTFQFHGRSVYQDSAPLLVFGGNVAVVSKIIIGVEPIGRFYTVDAARGNVVFTLDGRKAADVYEEFLGDYTYVQQAIQFPLAIYEAGEPGYYLRDPLNVNKDDGSIEFIGTFPEKSRARFITIDSVQMIKSADDANAYVLGESTGGPEPELVLVFSCTSRKHALGSQTVKELSKLLSCGKGIPFFGFYCYGEIGPVSIGEPTHFHNDTYVAVGIRSV